jgi:hypothetical protein
VKATLTFDLSGEDRAEEEARHRCAVQGMRLALSLWEMDQALRDEAKYKDNEEAQCWRTTLHEILAENFIVLEDLVL